VLTIFYIDLTPLSGHTHPCNRTSGSANISRHHVGPAIFVVSPTGSRQPGGSRRSGETNRLGRRCHPVPLSNTPASGRAADTDRQVAE
jgi:hypothetical protein